MKNKILNILPVNQLVKASKWLYNSLLKKTEIKKAEKKPKKMATGFEKMPDEEIMKFARKVVYGMSGNTWFKEEQTMLCSMAEVLAGYETAYAGSLHQRHSSNYKVLRLYRAQLVKHLNYIAYYVKLRSAKYKNNEEVLDSSGFVVKGKK